MFKLKTAKQNKPAAGQPKAEDFFRTARDTVQGIFQREIEQIEDQLDDEEAQNLSTFLGQLEESVWGAVDTLLRQSYKNGVHSKRRK